jgi:hypothetical protein
MSHSRNNLNKCRFELFFENVKFMDSNKKDHEQRWTSTPMQDYKPYSFKPKENIEKEKEIVQLGKVKIVN